LVGSLAGRVLAAVFWFSVEALEISAPRIA